MENIVHAKQPECIIYCTNTILVFWYLLLKDTQFHNSVRFCKC